LDKRIVASGIVVILIGLVFLGLSMAPSSTVIALDSSTRQIPVVGQLGNGRLDITVVVVTPSWTMDLINTNTAASIVGQTVPIGTDISFKGRLIGTDGQPISNYWVTVNLLLQGKVAESGDQCWLGSSKTDTNGYFGSGYYVEVRADGWWSNYPGVDGAYVQTKNGAGNPGCQTWATQSPSGKTYSGYAAVSSTYYSSASSFNVGAPATCPVTGDIYVNDVKVSTGATIRSPPSITFAFVPTSGASSIQSVTLKKATTDIAMPYQSSGAKYVLSQTWTTGTYTVGVTVTCTSGATNKVLSMSMDVGGSTTQVVDLMQGIRANWAIFAGGVLALGVVGVVVGYRKHD
jgi:hypothetical protein